jgi:hypothetical protein
MAPMTCGVCNRIKGKFVKIFLYVGPQSLQPLRLAGHSKAREIFQGFFSQKNCGLLLTLLEDAEVLAPKWRMVMNEVVVTGYNSLEFREANNSSSSF